MNLLYEFFRLSDGKFWKVSKQDLINWPLLNHERIIFKYD